MAVSGKAGPGPALAAYSRSAALFALGDMRSRSAILGGGCPGLRD
jgi:hypothetical protein